MASRAIRRRAGLRALRRNQVILSEGAAGDEFYVVVKGTVQVLDAGGQQVVVVEEVAGMPTVGHRLGAAGWRETNLV